MKRSDHLRMQDAVARRDSVASIAALKSSLVDINDSDIEINVEKGVVFISISDKMVFNTGSNKITARAKEVLEKFAESSTISQNLNLWLKATQRSSN